MPSKVALVAAALATFVASSTAFVMPVSNSIAKAALHTSRPAASALPARRMEVLMSVNSKVGAASKGKVVQDPLVIPEDYRVPAGFFLGGLGLATFGQNPGAGVPLALIAAALAARAKVVRFVFDEEAMEVLTLGKDGELELSGENFAVGGRNRWTYDSFTNWEFYPSPAFPILVYFKETQTSPEGQIHFFPVIMDGQQIYQALKKYVPLPGK